MTFFNMKKITKQKNKSAKETQLDQYKVDQANLLQARKKQLQN